jgi:hypothetical protein
MLLLSPERSDLSGDTSKEFLHLLKELIKKFLIENLNLELNKKLQFF